MISSILFTMFLSSFVILLSSLFYVNDSFIEQSIDNNKNIIQSKTAFSQSNANINCPSNMIFNISKGRCEIVVDINSNYNPCNSSQFTCFYEIIGNKKIYYTYPNNISQTISSTQNQDTLKDACAQALLQVCRNIMYECNSTNLLDVWGWLIATKGGAKDVVEINVDYYIQGTDNRIYIPPNKGLIYLSDIPVVNTTSTSCSDKVRKGQYYYNILVKNIGCHKYYDIDLNNLRLSTTQPCSIRNFIKEKNR